MSDLPGRGRRILVIDNYDSFVFNLVQYLGELGAQTVVWRNDAGTVDDVRGLRPDGVVISPGPGHPRDARLSVDVVRELGPDLPVLGVCLGHQVIGHVYGGRIGAAPELVHGKTSQVLHQGAGVLAGLPAPFAATRYHSLVVEREGLPPALEVTGETAGGLVMALRHRHHPVEGVQFHPESILTESGHQLLGNWLTGLG
ncbi:MAG TPA: aminodeoxychorismate/anthranilate synthase component II, partial [Actinomycetota bacterium]|nr:aminodeoxychorismate/anthranilate synthase component II [Actinomycetota bacterium]